MPSSQRSISEAVLAPIPRAPVGTLTLPTARGLARTLFGLTGVCAVVGIVFNIISAAQSTSPAYVADQFYSVADRIFNQFAYFSLLSNVVVAVTMILLALGIGRSSRAFRVFWVAGLVGIVVTGVVYHALLGGAAESALHLASIHLLHTVVPILVVAGWLAFGPRGLSSTRTALFSLIFPIAFLAFTLIRGAIINWYPYPFLNVTKLGYAGVSLNAIGLTIVFVVLTAGVIFLDRRLSRGAQRAAR